ncbi:MAG: diguanylate cyclase [Desulfobulbaceae bacterium]|nr:diguanylate cyclase [Desulfobulbaceae bacterium]
MTDPHSADSSFAKKFFRFVECPLVGLCFKTSITGKLVGMLVVSLFGFSLVTVQHTLALRKIDHRLHELQMVSMPQYKVSQYVLRQLNGFKISLIHILNQKARGNNADLNRDVILNRQRLDDFKRMLSTLETGGTIHDVARISNETLDVFTVEPAPRDSEIYQTLKDIRVELEALDSAFVTFTEVMFQRTDKEQQDEALADLLDNLDGLYGLVTTFTLEVNSRHDAMVKDAGAIIHNSQRNSLLISLVAAVVLSIGTVLYILMIVRPLKTILENIKGIARGKGRLTHQVDVKTNDEVGQLSIQLNKLVDNIFSLNTFKAIIEEEETTTDVHRRLAQLLHERYRFDKLIIYELMGNSNKMVVAYASDHELLCADEVLADVNLCRAKRTGHPISFSQHEDICKHFPYHDKYVHHCVPMIAGGRVIAVVQFMYDKNCAADALEQFEETVKWAMRYIKEATPVVEAKRFAMVLKETTLKDPMTDLYNRRFLESYVETLVANCKRRGSRIGVLMCDMDFFKEVNDTHGHEAGDAVIIKTAEIIKSCVRASDMVIRYGGEEFLVLLIDVRDRQAITELAERIRKTMESTTFKIPGGGTLKKTMSIGYSEFPTDTEGFWESIKFADVALYSAKESGRNRTIGFAAEMWTQETY